MRWYECFKIYNLKRLKKDYKVLLGVGFAILMTTLIMMIIPLIKLSYDKFNSVQAKEMNGADLRVIYDIHNEQFENEIGSLKNTGYDIKKYSIFGGMVNNLKKNMLLKVYEGDFSLNEDEIIICKAIAKSLNVKEGDKVSVVSEEKSKKIYTISKIEKNPIMVDDDSQMLGYCKIQGTADEVNCRNVLLINGKQIENVKQELQSKHKNYEYSTINDMNSKLKDQNKNQTNFLSILGSFSFILTLFSIFSVIILLVARRKKDIALLRLVNIKPKIIRISMAIELCVIYIIPIILAMILVNPICTKILQKFEITDY